MVSFTHNQQWKVILDDKSSNFNNQILKQYLHIYIYLIIECDKGCSRCEVDAFTHDM